MGSVCQCPENFYEDLDIKINPRMKSGVDEEKSLVRKSKHHRKSSNSNLNEQNRYTDNYLNTEEDVFENQEIGNPKIPNSLSQSMSKSYMASRKSSWISK